MKRTQWMMRWLYPAAFAIGWIGFVGPIDDAAAQGRGGGRGGAGFSGGGARPSMPNMGGMSRPSMPMSRPAPQMPMNRPSLGNSMPQARPAGPSNFPSNISRPSGNIGSMPGNMSRPMPGNIQLPSSGNSMNTNRPSLGGSMPTTRPAPGGISNITPPSNLTRPAPGNLGGQSPSTRPNIKLPGSSGSLTRPAPGGIGSGNIGSGGIGSGNMPTTRPAPLPGTGGPSLGGISRPPNQGGIGTNRPAPLPGIAGPGGTPTTKPAPGFDGNRPNLGGGNRPNIGGGNRPNIGGGNQPGLGGSGLTTRPQTKPTRPSLGGVQTLPGVVDNSNRPGGGGSGTWNRPDWNGNNNNWGSGNNNWGGGNWGNWGNNNNRPNWNNGNTNININNNNVNNNWYNNNYNRPAWDRPGYNNNWGNNNWGNNWGYRPNYNWNNGWHDNCIHPHYHGWYNGCWSGYWGSSWYSPIVWGGIGWGLGSITSSYFNTGYAAYSNPYYVAPVVGTTTVASSVPYDYSQPVVINNYITAESQGSTASSTSSPTTNANPTSNANIEASFGDFDKGLSSFKEGNYQAALNSFNTALSKNSGDPVVHEVRALSLFALGDYTSAAVALNSLLAAAPGMDWTTVSSLYGNSDDYTAQLRKLEEYCKANPKNPASAFVLAYHYLVIGQKESAIRALKVVVENQPKDVTAKRMLEALDPKPIEAKAAAPKAEGQPQAEELAKPAPEVDLVGKWQAVAGTTTIDLSIDEESKFVWKATESGKPSVELAGDFGTNGSAVLMETTDKGSLGGTVKSINADEWILNPPGATDDTAGLKFKRVK
jgi:tetratricopeptide (TPR) repeat protein